MRDIKFNYENKANGSYLVYEIDDIEKIDKLEQNMMSNNNIDGLLEFSYSSIDDRYCFKYDITSKITLKMYLERCKDEYKLIKIFINILKLFVEIEDFLISKEHILLDDDYVFIDVSNLKTYFICLPLESMSSNDNEGISDLKQFISIILNGLRLENFENKSLINLLRELFNKEDFSNMEETIKVLKNMSQGKKSKTIGSENKTKIEKRTEFEGTDNIPKQDIKKTNGLDFLVPKQEKRTDEKKEEKKDKKNLKDIFKISILGNKKEEKEDSKNKKSKSDSINKKTDIEKKSDIKVKSIKHKRNVIVENYDDEDDISENNGAYNYDEEINYDKTVIINSSAENDKTVLLSALNSGLHPSMPYLIRKKNNEKINITSNLFRIGKEIDYVDYAILDNPTISRAHADIIKINRDYFIQDNNSKNHTYINEIMIDDGQAAKLEQNCEVKLSDEVFVFKLY